MIEISSLFFQKAAHDISRNILKCRFMKCQVLFSGKNNKNVMTDWKIDFHFREVPYNRLMSLSVRLLSVSEHGYSALNRWEYLYFLAYTLRKHAYSNKLKILRPKKGTFQIKKIWYFSYSCSKHRLWVLVRAASMRRFYRVPTIYVFSRNKQNYVYLCKPHFY